MIWSVKKGDMLKFTNHIYHYEVIEVQGNKVLLERCINHMYITVKYPRVMKEATIIRRSS